MPLLMITSACVTRLEYRRVGIEELDERVEYPCSTVLT